MLWLVVSASASPQSADCTDGGCAHGEHWVVETPQGIQDGWNVTFTLRHIPSQTVPVTISRNGIRLNARDVKILGRTLSFLPSQAPVQGDWVTAQYLALPDGNEPEISDSHASSSKRGQDEITLQAARLALHDELSLSRPDLARVFNSSGRQIFERPNVGSHLSSAVEMLESRESGQNQRSYRDYLRGQADTQGIDGFGDVQIPSSFNESRDHGERQTESVPASVHMLEERVEKTEERDARGDAASELRTAKKSVKDRSKGKAILHDIWRSAKD